MSDQSDVAKDILCLPVARAGMIEWNRHGQGQPMLGFEGILLAALF